MPTMGDTHRRGEVDAPDARDWMRASNAEPQRDGTLNVVSEADAAICPDCQAGPGELCRNLVSGYGHPPIPHPKRTKLAKLLRTAEPPVLGS